MWGGRQAMLLYHATYKVRIPSIKKLGLGAKQIKNYKWSTNNVVCLANDPYLAESFLEDGVVEDVAESVLNSGIVILVVHANNLNISLLSRDRNMNTDEVNCFEYKGVIHQGLLGVWDESGIIPLLNIKRIKGRQA